MAFEPQLITKEHVLAAVAKIDTEQIELEPSTVWDVVINGKRYPPKEIMRYAHEEMNGENIWNRSGGSQTNDRLEKFGFEIKPKTIDPNIELINRYKSHIKANGLKDEIYKWKLVKEFNGRPNVNAADFAKEITSIKYSNLIYKIGLGVIGHIAKEKPEEFREAFKVLLNPEIALEERIRLFDETTLKTYRSLVPEKNLSHHQDERTMATYLTYFDPSKYAFYKDSFYTLYCKLLGVPKEKKGKKYVHYLKLLDDFIENYLREDQDLIDLINQNLDDDCYADDNFKILAQDILYTTLDLQKGQGRNYWRIGTTEGDVSYWELMKVNGYSSIGWPEIGDLNDLDIKNKNDILLLFKEEGYYKDDKRLASRKAGEVLQFYQDIKEGDIILAQDGADVLGIGIVDGGYDYNSNYGFPHLIKVDWKLEPEKFHNKDGLRTTVCKLTDQDTIMRVEQLLAGEIILGAKPIKTTKVGNTNYNLNQILFGPPGTGKTFNTINRALEICGEDITGLKRKDVKKLFDEKVKKGQIAFTTFHQSMTYEDFVEGIKPIEPGKEGDPVIYKIRDGIFKEMCTNAKTPNQSDFEESYNQLAQSLQEDDSIIIMKTPTGKEFGIGLNRNLNLNLFTGNAKQKQGVLTKENILKQINGESKFDGWNGYFTGIIDHLKEKYGYNPISQSEGQNYVLIIDEINRGNVSQIFGELITLLEKDKRLGNKETITLKLPYSKEDFAVPYNLYVIGTMNTADRSVEALDAALRRRFSFIEMQPQPSLIYTEGKAENGIVNGIELPNLLSVLNNRIEKLIDKDHMIGHSYFLKVKDINGLKDAFQNEIIPLLQEYFFGDIGKIGLVVGQGFFEKYEQDDNEDFFAPFDDYESGSLIDKKVYHLLKVSEMSDDDFVGAINLLLRK